MPSARTRLRQFWHSEQLILAVLAVVIGLAAGLGAVGFRYAISGVQFAVFGSGTNRLASYVASLPWWQVMLAPAVGGLVVGLMAHYLTRDRRFHVVSDVIEASTLHGGRMRLRDGCMAAIGSFVSLGFGASAGREGPVVHIGATISSAVAQWCGLRRSLTMTLLGCGVSAGIAASFNAPIAGAFFALEVVVGHYGLRAFAPVVLSSVIGTIVSRIAFGDFPAFLVNAFVIVSLWETPAFALLGILAAIVAYIFMASIFMVQDVLGATKLPGWFKPVLGGLGVGAMALLFPQVLGVGYEATDASLQGSLPLAILIALVAVKTAATALTLGSGFGGGIFSPSLFVGAMLGGAFGLVAAMLFPDYAGHHSAYSIVGMAAVAGAVLGAPISTILIVFELTANFDLTIAVMIAVALASLITNHAIGKSFFSWQLERRGIDLTGGQVRYLMRDTPVRRILDRSPAMLSPDADRDVIRSALDKRPKGDFLVVDGNQQLMGVLTLEDLRALLFGELEGQQTTAESLARPPSVMLLPGDSLADALDRMDQCDDDFLPVVADRDSRRVEGILRKRDLIREHNRALVEASDESRGGTV